jgi:hypothetical protein
MMSLDEAVSSVLWAPWSSRVVEIGGSGGELVINGSSNFMVLEIADGGELSETAFNDTVGQVAFELPYSNSLDTGIFLKGDARAIVNQSGSGITQLSVERGAEHPEIQLCYRPILSYAYSGVENGRVVNSLRFYVVTLNSSKSGGLVGTVSMRVSCATTEMITKSCDIQVAGETALVTCRLGESSGQVIVPIQSNSLGAIVHIEVVQCQVEIEQVVR